MKTKEYGDEITTQMKYSHDPLSSGTNRNSVIGLLSLDDDELSLPAASSKCQNGDTQNKCTLQVS